MNGGVDREFANWIRRRVTRTLPVLFMVGGSLASCGGRSAVGFIEEGSEDPSGDGDGDGDGDSCSGYQERCIGNREEYCFKQEWVTRGDCPPGTTCVLDGSATYCSDGMDLVCPPSITWCSGEGDLLVCNPEGRGFQTVSCAEGAICVDGACIPQPCDPGVVYCRNNSIYTCSDDGASVLLVEDCDPGFECLSQPFVHCDEVICKPSRLACANGNVVRCSLDGTEWKVVDSCSANEACLEGEATCLPQLCAPDAPLCVGNSTAVCDPSGTAYLIGMDCGSEVCGSGKCGSEYHYFEDFETASLSSWLDRGFGYDYSVTNLTSASGSYSVTLSGGINSHYDGIYHQFSPGLTPERVTYWARQDTLGGGTYFTLHDTDSQPALENEVLFIYFRNDGNLAVGSSEGSSAVGPWEPRVWYEISVAIDWPNHEFDIFVDGALLLSEHPFRGSTGANEIGQINLYHYEDSVGYWDSITFE